MAIQLDYQARGMSLEMVISLPFLHQKNRKEKSKL